MIGIALIVIATSLILYAIKLLNDNNQYWKKRGVKYFKPLPLFGNALQVILQKKTFYQIIQDFYQNNPNEPYIGTFEFTTPRLVIFDNELIQRVLIKDFGNFVDHGFHINEEKNPLDAQLFVMTGNKWRALRTRMVPIFTSGKLKSMFETMTDVGKNLVQYLDKRIDTDIDIREAMGLFSMDIIGTAAFGFNPGVLENPESEFRTMGRRLFELKLIDKIRFILVFSFPKIFQKFGISLQNKTVMNYYCKIIRDTIDYRQKNNIQRNDFIQMMLQLKEKGVVELKNWDITDEYLKNDFDSTEKFEITENILMAQAHSFLTAGFEATALLLTYSLLELCQNLEMQEKTRQEILEQVKLNGGLTYDALKNMKYLDQIIKETQRYYPFIPVLFRVCTKDFVLPDGATIKKGDNVLIPVNLIHQDPNIYPDPKKFNPDRFEEAPKPGTFLPFGEGPRMCIAMRYAQLVIKYGLALFLINYKGKISPKTKLPVEFTNSAIFNQPVDKILFNIEKI